MSRGIQVERNNMSSRRLECWACIAYQFPMSDNWIVRILTQPYTCHGIKSLSPITHGNH
jgi:hypothetical protein